MFAGVKSVHIDVGKEEVLVESALTSAEVQALIERTGRRAVLKGIGGSEQGEPPRDRSKAASRTKTDQKVPQASRMVDLLLRNITLYFYDRPGVSSGHAGRCGTDPGGGAFPAAV